MAIVTVSDAAGIPSPNFLFITAPLSNLRTCSDLTFQGQKTSGLSLVGAGVGSITLYPFSAINNMGMVRPSGRFTSNPVFRRACARTSPLRVPSSEQVRGGPHDDDLWYNAVEYHDRGGTLTYTCATLAPLAIAPVLERHFAAIPGQSSCNPRSSSVIFHSRAAPGMSLSQHISYRVLLTCRRA